jgi:hypothetical protein
MARLPQFSLRTALLVVAVIAASLGLVVLPIQRAARLREIRNTLLTVGLAYHHCLDVAGAPPAKTQDMAQCGCGCGAGAFAMKAIADGRVVVFWNADVRVPDNGTYVLGYEKDVPVHGGQVLMADGSVRRVDASEFQAMPKLQTEDPTDGTL